MFWSLFRTVAKLTIPVQTAWDPAKDGYFEDLSFSPAHALVAHRPLGGINRARLLAYTMLAARRLADNGKSVAVPTSVKHSGITNDRLLPSAHWLQPVRARLRGGLDYKPSVTAV